MGSGGGPGTRRNNNPGGVQKKLIQRHKQLGTTNGLSNTDFKIGEVITQYLFKSKIIIKKIYNIN